MTITYDESFDEFNPEIKEEVSRRIETVIHLFPTWSQNLIVFYERDNANQRVLACQSNYYYRFIHLVIYPDFLRDDQWEISLYHEIQHAILAPYTTKVESIIKQFIQDEKLLEYLTQELTDEEEAVVQDSAYLLSKLMCKST